MHFHEHIDMPKYEFGDEMYGLEGGDELDDGYGYPAAKKSKYPSYMMDGDEEYAQGEMHDEEETDEPYEDDGEVELEDYSNRNYKKLNNIPSIIKYGKRGRGSRKLQVYSKRKKTRLRRPPPEYVYETNQSAEDGERYEEEADYEPENDGSQVEEMKLMKTKVAKRKKKKTIKQVKYVEVSAVAAPEAPVSEPAEVDAQDNHQSEVAESSQPGHPVKVPAGGPPPMEYFEMVTEIPGPLASTISEPKEKPKTKLKSYLDRINIGQYLQSPFKKFKNGKRKIPEIAKTTSRPPTSTAKPFGPEPQVPFPPPYGPQLPPQPLVFLPPVVDRPQPHPPPHLQPALGPGLARLIASGKHVIVDDPPQPMIRRTIKT